MFPEKLKGDGCNQTVFEDDAIEAILNAADGTLRIINKYCNQSMLIGDVIKPVSLQPTSLCRQSTTASLDNYFFLTHFIWVRIFYSA